jgi:predicted AAA+ superfamily ATPase
MIIRKQILLQISEFASVFPVCAIIGPRQAGKTTLALEYARTFSSVLRFDLEDPTDYQRFQDPKMALQETADLIIIDEIQRIPALFPYLRVFVDQNPQAHLLILGSSSPDLLRQCGESLAGRIGYIELTPFSLEDTKNWRKLWQRGGFPKSYLAVSDSISTLWLKQYIASFLERDLALMGFGIDSFVMRTLWAMIAHYHANLVNYADLGRSLNVTDPTIKKYLLILESTFMIRLLRPWHANISKRQVKQPKVYIRDSGILHFLLGISFDPQTLHPKIGASWEGFALEEVIRAHKADRDSCYFWRTQDGSELDLLIMQPGKKMGFEFKYGEAVSLSRSLRIAQEDLQLDSLTIICASQKKSWFIAPSIEIISLEQYIERILLSY